MAAHQVVTDYTNYAENANVKVFVRARPLEAKDEDGNDLFDLGEKDDKGRVRKITMKQWRREEKGEEWGGVNGNAFKFDGLFWKSSEQSDIFDNVCREQVDHVLRGFNACCFAYGQTGSGKTHSMFFPRGGGDRGDAEKAGLIPRAVDYLFQRLGDSGAQAELHVSFLEVYCDTLRDLGKGAADRSGPLHRTADIFEDARKRNAETFGRAEAPAGGLRRTNSAGPMAAAPPPAHGRRADKDALSSGGDDDHRADLSAKESDAASLWYELKEEIREDADGNVFVKGLARLRVTTCAEVLDIIDRGLRLRATEATRMNDTSSRSHTVFTIEVVIPSQAGDKPTTGKLHLVDLAGSERLKKSESSGLRLFEALHINKSLMALGKVIVALDPSERSKNAHVPYRDSKLTRLLQNALGGDSFTSLLATIRPAKDHAEECLSTLQFANRCRRVANNPQVHRLGETPAEQMKEKDRLIKRLLDDMALLKADRDKLRHQLAQALGLETASQLDADAAGAKAGNDPALQQQAVVTAVLAALRFAGVSGCAVDAATGAVRLGDGRVLDCTLPAAFSKAAASTARPGRGHVLRGSDGKQASSSVSAISARIARIFGWPPDRVPGSVVDVLNERESKVASLQLKLNDAKEDVLIAKRDSAAQAAQLSAAALTAQSKAETLRKDAVAAAHENAEALLDLEKQHGHAFDAVLHESKVWFEQGAAHARLGRDAGASAAAADGDGAIHARRDAAAARAAAGRAEARAANTEGTVAALTAQYEHWLGVKDAEALGFLMQLDAYRAYKRRQLKAADSELAMLWAALEKHAGVLRRIRAGRYPLRQAGDHHAAPHVPAGELPAHVPTIDELPATRRAVRKGAERAASRRGGGPDADAESAADEPERPCLAVTAPAPVGGAFFAAPRTSPRSRTTAVRAPPAGDRALVTDPRRRGSVSSSVTPQTAAHPALRRDDDDDGGAPCDGDDGVASKPQLLEMLHDAREELARHEARFEKKVQERVANELASHRTVECMRDLERRRGNAEAAASARAAKASEHAKKYAQLRVAFEAHLRAQEKPPATASFNASAKPSRPQSAHVLRRS